MKLTAIKENSNINVRNSKKININISNRMIDILFIPENIRIKTNNFSLLEEIVKEIK